MGRFPQAQWIGIDPSPGLLAAPPPGVEARPGSLLRIPLPDAVLDGAMAIESLEHALLPQPPWPSCAAWSAPAGACRSSTSIAQSRASRCASVGSGGSFPAELTAWLSRACDDVQVEPVSHLEGRPGRDLFLAARRKRALNRSGSERR